MLASYILCSALLSEIGAVWSSAASSPFLIGTNQPRLQNVLVHVEEFDMPESFSNTENSYEIPVWFCLFLIHRHSCSGRVETPSSVRQTPFGNVCCSLTFVRKKYLTFSMKLNEASAQRNYFGLNDLPASEVHFLTLLCAVSTSHTKSQLCPCFDEPSSQVLVNFRKTLCLFFYGFLRECSRHRARSIH